MSRRVSKEEKLIKDRAAGTTMRAIDHKREMEQVFVYREGQRLMNTKGIISQTKDDGSSLTQSDYEVIATDIVNVRHEQRLDRIATIKRDMLEKHRNKRLEQSLEKDRANQRSTDLVKENPKPVINKSGSGWFQRIFNKTPPTKKAPENIPVIQKKVTIDYTSKGEIKQKTSAERTTSYAKDENGNTLTAEFKKKQKRSTYENGKTKQQFKQLTIQRHYTIGGALERSVHSLVERRIEKPISPTKDRNQDKAIGLKASFNRVRSRG